MHCLTGTTARVEALLGTDANTFRFSTVTAHPCIIRSVSIQPQTRAESAASLSLMDRLQPQSWSPAPSSRSSSSTATRSPRYRPACPSVSNTTKQPHSGHRNPTQDRRPHHRSQHRHRRPADVGYPLAARPIVLTLNRLRRRCRLRRLVSHPRGLSTPNRPRRPPPRSQRLPRARLLERPNHGSARRMNRGRRGAVKSSHSGVR